jgi:arylsulfatase A-like enzyme
MARDRPNVVLVVLDTARYKDVLTEAKGRRTTPFLDELARAGTRYDRAFTPASWTLPAHASLFTGTYPSRHGAHAGHKQLDADLPTLAELLRDAGYETVGVSNNTWISEEFGFGRGFETFRKTWQYVQTETDLGRVARTEEGAAKFRALARTLFDGNPVANLVNTVYGQFFRKKEDSGAKSTNDWIGDWVESRRSASPFFLFVNYLEPHLPYRPPREYARPFLPDHTDYEGAMAVPQDAWRYVAGQTDHDREDFEALRALYRGELAYVDERLRELRDILAAANKWEDTVLVVVGDHGENIGDHGLMDHQYCLYETLLHVPLVVHGGAFTGGGRVDQFVQLPDLVPTLLDAANVDGPNGQPFQGRSVHPDVATGEREQVFAEYLAPQPSMEALETRLGTLPQEVRQYDRSLRTVRVGNEKLIRGSDGTTRRLAVGVRSRGLRRGCLDGRRDPTSTRGTRLSPVTRPGTRR